MEDWLKEHIMKGAKEDLSKVRTKKAAADYLKVYGKYLSEDDRKAVRDLGRAKEKAVSYDPLQDGVSLVGSRRKRSAKKPKKKAKKKAAKKGVGPMQKRVNALMRKGLSLTAATRQMRREFGH